MKNLSLNLVLAALFLTLSLVCGQEEEDAQSINPDVCGLTAKKAKIVLQREKRHASSQVAGDQREWGWLVLTVTEDGFASSGSLINSQWVLSRALFSKYKA
jgi:hypothetical protein